jgi:light-harvesting protein B-800-850 alpha chain
VVKPTVGLPLLLGSVTVIALGVHASVLSNTSWMSKYWQGAAPRTASIETAPAANIAAVSADPAFTVTVTPTTTEGGTPSFVITVAPRTGSSVASAAGPERLAMAVTQ